MKNKKLTKIFTVVMALVLVAACSVGATLAYLTAKSDTVTNTFVAGKIVEKGDFYLKEHKAIPAVNEEGKALGVGYYALDPKTEVLTNEYTVIPGVDLPKDPFVSVKPAAEAYVFITVDNDMIENMTFKMDDQWEQLTDDGHPVLFKENPVYTLKAGIVKPSEDPQVFNILKNGITVGNVDTSKLTADSTTLTFNGYLVQAGSFSNALAAWEGAAFD